ncbi:exotoxin beta-grasp domain-containing protein [Staphylococcus aureus]
MIFWHEKTKPLILLHYLKKRLLVVLLLRRHNDKHYKLNVTYKDKAETFTGGFQFMKAISLFLTLKELDFRIRQTLIKSKKLYNNSYNKGQIKITGTDNNYTIDLSKRLPSTNANRYVKKPQNAKIEVILEKSN